MQCPICQVMLQMTERQGVEIDYCPKCRGVWLDRGELQKIIDLSMAQASAKPATLEPPKQVAPRSYQDHDYADREDHRYEPQRHESYRHDSYPAKPKKRESWFSELFDWD